MNKARLCLLVTHSRREILTTVQHAECCERGSHRGLKEPRGRPNFDRGRGSQGRFGRGKCCPSSTLGPRDRRFALQECAQLGEGLGTPKKLAKEESAIDSSFRVTHEGGTQCMDPAPLPGCRGRRSPTQWQDSQT